MQIMVPRIFCLISVLISFSSAYAACTVSTTQPVSFGNYNPFSLTAVDTTGIVNVSCSGLVGIYSYQVSLNAGSYGTFSGREMASGANRLTYNLFTDNARTLIWGDGTGGTNTQSASCIIVLSTCSNNQTVYGRISAQQNVAAGAYTDSVTVTVNY